MTFGCLNNFCKVSDLSLRSWGNVMAADPGLASDAACAGRARIARGCWRFCTSSPSSRTASSSCRIRPRRAYLETYQRIDLCLDTLPYNGHTTSLDAYWMGVPVVTRVGRTVAGRAGWSQLNNLELTELAAIDDATVRGQGGGCASDLHGTEQLCEPGCASACAQVR